MSNRVLVFGAALVVSSGLALAGGGTITSGDASMTFLGGPSIFSAPFGDVEMKTDAGAVDVMNKYSFSYRTQNNNQNNLMSLFDTPTESYTGNQAKISYRNAGVGPIGEPTTGRFDADFTITLEDGASAGSARVTSTVRFKNVSTTRQTFQLFHIANFDLDITSPADDSGSTLLNNNVAKWLQYTDKNTDAYAQSIGYGAKNFSVGAGGDLRVKVTSGSWDLDNNTTISLVDVAGAFQWSLDLAVGAEIEITTVSAYNMAVPTPGALAVLGLGGLMVGRRRR